MGKPLRGGCALSARDEDRPDLKKINFITNIAGDAPSGGWSGMSHQVRDQLARHFDLNKVQGIAPPYPFLQVQASRLSRTLGLPGVYPVFAEARLRRIRDMVTPQLAPDADLDFFHGATPWLGMDHPRPYALYLDACFATYMTVYQDARRFNRKQLDRLKEREAKMLGDARAVFFSSAWSMEDTRNQYRLEGKNFHVAGLGGGWSDVEPADAEQPPYFLFVGLDFIGKGGGSVVEAFTKLLGRHPELRLKIVGQEPPSSIPRSGNMDYLGFINQADPAGSASMKELYRKALAFVMPTGRDMTPLVLLEAGSAGCPVISTRRFGIPEMVEDKVTGILLDDTGDLVQELYTAMSFLLEDPARRESMGRQARSRVLSHFTWERTGDIIVRVLNADFEKAAKN